MAAEIQVFNGFYWISHALMWQMFCPSVMRKIIVLHAFAPLKEIEKYIPILYKTKSVDHVCTKTCLKKICE